MDDHAEFLDFSVLKLPTYDAILGKAWLDRWNPVIDWKKYTMQWKVGSTLISVTGEQNPYWNGDCIKYFSESVYSSSHFSTKNEEIVQDRISIHSSNQRKK